MICSLRILSVGLLIVALIAACRLSMHYRDQYRDAAEQADALQATINYMQQRQQAAAALDAKYTQELKDAKLEIEQLRDDVADGRKRLQLNATCPPAPATSSTTGGTHAASARPTDAAQRDYFTLRERISTATAQIAGLQQYIREQCLK